MENNEMILYQPDETLKLDVRVENEEVWLNRNQIALLFDRDVKTIGKHINNALKEELDGIPVVANFEFRPILPSEHYNLEMITSVGYRVKSRRGIQFRQWANKILKQYILRGYSINQRLLAMENRIDRRLADHDRRLDDLTDKVDFFVRTSLPPVEGVFFNGQIFDAHKFVSSIIKSAVNRIVLIDNYIDESVLTLIDKRGDGVDATIITQPLSRQLRLDIERHNRQYPPVAVREATKIHDRFLIADTAVYHIGASVKDLGRKLFAFSKMSIPPELILDNITPK